MRQLHNIKKSVLLALVAVSAVLVQSCKEEIDTSDRYTFTQYTVASYLEDHLDTYGVYYRLLGEVNISSRSESTVQQLMSARGNFTVFAPTDQAIQEYLDSLYHKGIITAPSWDGFPNNEVLDSIRQIIVYNSIIDGGDDNEAYQTSALPSDGEEISIANMNDRKLRVYYKSDDLDYVYINATKDEKTKKLTGGSLIDLKNRDIVAINGVIHQVHSVVAPSNQTVGDVLKDYVDLGDENYSIMATMVLACGLQDTLSQIKDETYEAKYKNEQLADVKSSSSIGTGYLPEHRKYGYTIFAETNDWWHNAIHKPVNEITLADLEDFAAKYYPNAKNDDDYTNPDNALNQFITYHILPMKISADKLVIHYNEKGYYYTPSSNPYTIPVWEIYTTMGKRRLLKLYEGGHGAPSGIFLNRFPNLDNGRDGTYYELSCDEDKTGVQVNRTEAREIINGYIYPISDLLVYSEETQNNFQKQRMRFDVAGLFPEFMNNDIRANRVNTKYVGMPCDVNYKYLDNLEIVDGSNFCYLPGIGYTWQNLQGDEFNVTGRYELIFTLPPVPKKGTYEIRYAVQNNSNLRSMCQVYFGSDPDRLPAMGVPLDLRIGGASSQVGWVEDVKGDDETNAENDKKMRNKGFMKGAEAYHAGNKSSSTARATQTTTRRIIVRQEMDPDKTYYLKFKSVLNSETLEFYMDYIEFCAKEVYDNPNTPEDIW